MTIEQTTIDRLIAQSKEVQNADFETGRDKGREWAEDAHFQEVRAILHALPEAPRGDDLAHWLHNCTILDTIRDLSNAEFAEMLGKETGDGSNIDDLASGFLKGVQDFCQEAKAKGVPF